MRRRMNAVQQSATKGRRRRFRSIADDLLDIEAGLSSVREAAGDDFRPESLGLGARKPGGSLAAVFKVELRRA